MKLIVDIPQEMITALEQGSFGAKYNMYDLVGCLMNGTPLEDIKAEITFSPIYDIIDRHIGERSE